MLPDVSQIDVINQSHIAELMPREKEDGGSLLKRLFQIYVEETPRLLEELERALAAKDEEGCYDIVHQMKGSAAAMGATRVYAITEAVLHRCREGEGLDREGLVEAIETQTDLYISEMMQLLGGAL